MKEETKKADVAMEGRWMGDGKRREENSENSNLGKEG